MKEIVQALAEIKIECPYFLCEREIAHHLKKVFEGEYEVPLTYSQEQPVVLDLGANFGAFSVWASHRWPGCTVHAYEPNPETFSVLEKNVALFGKVTPYNWGIGSPGMRVLSDGLENSGECSFHQVANNPAPTGRHCEVRDPLSLPEARILKMDIEGCEVEVLEPLLAAGRKFDAIMFEFHNRDIRLRMEKLLEKDYVLTGAHLYSVDLGVLRFMNRRLI